MSSNLMQGKRGLIMGLANDKSIAWGIAKACADAGAELAFSYQGDALKKRVDPLAASVGSDIVLPCDVSDMDSVDALFTSLEEKWGKLDFVVHAIGFSDKGELRGRYVDTSRENGIRVNAISAGPIKTLAASGIGDFRYILKWNELNSPLRRTVTIDDVGKSALYLLSDLSSGVTGETHHVDSGYHVVGMKAVDAPDISTV